MNKQNSANMQKGKFRGNLSLVIILIGFCILALIEIFYGQTQIRLAKERLTPEDENQRTVQNLKSSGDNSQGNTDVGVEPVQGISDEQSDITATENTPANIEGDVPDSISEQSAESEQQAEDDKKYSMQIVVLGDSIMADQRENNGDVPTLIGEATNAKVYNLAVGGTTAALMPEEQFNFADWNSKGFLGVVNAMLGNISPDIFAGYETERILRECDFSKTDYFVIEYGINDFTSGKVPQSRYLADGGMLNIDEAHTYAGALDIGVRTLVERFPDAKILLVSPHYCQFFEDETYVGDAYSVNYGYGTLVEFYRIVTYVAGQHKGDGVLYFNAMEQSGIDAYTADEFLEDGVHLSNEGRRMYADQIAGRINADFYREE